MSINNSIFKCTEYLNRIQGRLNKFCRVSKDTYNFRCPCCGDSQKDSSKARGYLFPADNGLIYKCHNCGISLSFGGLLKEIDPSLHREYLFDIGFSNRIPDEKRLEKPKKKHKPKKTRLEKFLLGLPNLASVSEDNPGLKYLRSRKIPVDTYPFLYYIDDTARFNDIFPEKEGKIKTNKGIVFPFRDFETGNIVGCSTRLIDGTKKFRYLTLKNKDYSDSLMVFHRGIDQSRPVYVVEGQFDSLFIDNSIAMGNASLYMIGNTDYICVFDNEPHNKDVMKIQRKTIEEGFPVVIWDKGIMEKDINDMILSGIDVEWQLKNRVFSGIKARVRLK